MSLKPEGCTSCPLYNSTMVSGAGVRPAKVVFLDVAPPSWAASALVDRGGKLVKFLLEELKKKEGNTGPVTKMVNEMFFMYTLGCGTNTPTVDTIRKCRDTVTSSRLLQTGASVVVALGPMALTFLGIKDKITEVRGSKMEIDFYGKKLTVLPSFSTSQLLANPGLSDIAKRDYQKAAELVQGKPLDSINIEELTSGYTIPKTLEEAIAACDEFSSYTHDNKTVSNSLMSLDFETTSLFAWDPKARVIAVSCAVNEGKALSMFVCHSKSPYTFKDIAPSLMKLLGSPHPKTWWNYKYDLGIAKYALSRQLKEAARQDTNFIQLVEAATGRTFEEVINTPIVNTRWDGMLAEHMLEEEKTGQYSLKVVVGEHYPSLIGYEKPLHEELSKLEAEFVQNTVSKAVGKTSSNPFTPLVHGSSNFSLDEELTSLTEKLKDLKASKRRKGISSEEKFIIEKTIDVLDTRVTHLKKVISNTVKLAEKYANMFTNSPDVPLDKGITFEDVSPDLMLPYAAIDADLTWRISQKQRVRAHQEDTPQVAKNEGRSPMIKLMDLHYIPLTEALVDMQVEGVRVNRSYLLGAYNKLYDDAIELEKDIVAKLQQDLNKTVTSEMLNNSTSLANIMIAGYGLPKIKTTDAGEASADKDVMQEWADMGNPVAGMIIKFRAMTKGRTTYLRNLLDLSNYDGRIHGSIHVNGTATGRLSSTNPNLQNQPPEIAGVKIKAAFVPTDTSSSASEVEKLICKKYNWSENEEMCIVDMDFAGAEVRGLTTYAKDKSLLEALDSGLDMHSWVASMCFGETYDAINTARNVPKNLQTENDKRLTTLRKHAKAVVFGIIFCISAPKLANDLGITTDEAEKLMNTFFTRFPNIENYIRTTKEKVYSKGILRTPTGRARRFPLAAYGGSIGAACARQGVNFLVQGFTSEIVNRVLINCKSKFKSIRARMILTVHDSLVFEMPVSELNKLEAFLKENVRDFIKATFPQVPVEVPYDVEVGPSYGEAKSSISDYYAKKCNSVV